ncbi:MAG: PEGA domain-containing protein, partial [Gemmatimonadota bacterium]
KSGKRDQELSRWSTPRSPMPQISAEMAAANAMSAGADDTPPAARTPPARERVAPRAKPRRTALKAVLLACAIVMVGVGGWLAYDVVVPMISRTDAGITAVEQEPSALPQDSIATPASRPAPSEQQAAADLAELESPQTGRMLVQDLPDNGIVYIDDRRTEGTEIELASGVHVIRMEAPGYEPMEETITVAAGTSFNMRFASRRVPSRPRERPATPPQPPPMGFLGLAIQNTQATVRIDETDLGSMRRGVIPLEANVQHHLRLERQGYVPFDTVIVVTPGDTVRLAKSLVRRQR